MRRNIWVDNADFKANDTNNPVEIATIILSLQ